MGYDSIMPEWFYIVFIFISIGLFVYALNVGITQIDELGSAICDQQKPLHTLEFDNYYDKIVYCKTKPNETSYDGLKIRIGGD